MVKRSRIIACNAKSRRVLHAAVLCILLLSGSAWGKEPARKVDDRLLALRAGETAPVIVRLSDQLAPSLVNSEIRGRDKARRGKNLVNSLKGHASRSQQGLREILERKRSEGRVSRVKHLWIFNGISLTAGRDVLDELAARPEVESIYPDELITLGAPVVEAAAPPEENLDLVNAPALWAKGYTGQGVVVASMDSGVDVEHPDLATRYRGGTNSWFDPYGEHAAPYDSIGHGTQTMGVMVGGDAGGTSVGMAPGATWISAKIFSDLGVATLTGVHEAFQWMLDPDGDPETADSPDVVNGSWGFNSADACIDEFQADVAALRAAGIVPVFAAGNLGPSATSSVSPANYPESVSVGATDLLENILSASSRGPSACDGSIFPKLVAPGVGVRTTDLSFGGNAYYANVSGTSFSAPHVSGAVALLLSSSPSLTVEQLEHAFVNSALDLGDTGPDNTFGNGRLDVLAALNAFTPANVSAAAADGFTGAAQQATAVWTDANGASDIKTVFLNIGSSASGGTVKVKYEHAAGLLYLRNDAGTAWLGGFAPGSSNTISNLIMTLDCATTTVTPSDNDLAVSFNLTPAMTYYGTKPLLMYVYDKAMNHPPAYQQKGTWRITPDAIPVNVSAGAATGQVDVAQQVTATWSDANGFADIKRTFLQAGTLATGGMVRVKYERAANKVYLLNDAGTAWLGGFTPGSANTVGNSRTTLDAALTTVTPSGNSLTVSFNLKPLSGFSGVKNVLLYVYDNEMNHPVGWQKRGSWTISP